MNKSLVFIFIIFLSAMLICESTAHANFQMWQDEVDSLHADNTKNITLASPLTEYRHQSKKISIDLNSISVNEVRSRIVLIFGAAEFKPVDQRVKTVLRNASQQELSLLIRRRPSDDYLSFLYCDLVGLDAGKLLSRLGACDFSLGHHLGRILVTQE